MIAEIRTPGVYKQSRRGMVGQLWMASRAELPVGELLRLGRVQRVGGVALPHAIDDLEPEESAQRPLDQSGIVQARADCGTAQAGQDLVVEHHGCLGTRHETNGATGSPA